MPGFFEYPDEQLVQAAGGMRAEHFVLLEHHPVVARLVLAGRKMTVPEQRELFFERPVGREHPVRPPEAETLCFDRIRREAVEELVNDRLQLALRSFRSDPFAEPFPVLTRESNGLCATRRKRIDAGSQMPDSSNGLRLPGIDSKSTSESTACRGVIAARRTMS